MAPGGDYRMKKPMDVRLRVSAFQCFRYLQNRNVAVVAFLASLVVVVVLVRGAFETDALACRQQNPYPRYSCEFSLAGAQPVVLPLAEPGAGHSKQLQKFQATPHDFAAFDGLVKKGQPISDVSRALHVEIARRQNPPDCSTAKVLLWRVWNFGFMADAQSVAFALMLGFRLNRAVVLEGADWLFTHGCACSDRNYCCYFEKLSTCDIRALQDEAVDLTMTDLQTGTRVLRFTQSNWFDDDATKNIHQNMALLDQLFPLPKEFSTEIARQDSLFNAAVKPGHGSSPTEIYTQPTGQVWYGSHFLGYVLRPQPNLLNDAKRFLGSSVWETLFNSDTKVIGMHIRQGDKGIETPLVSFENYMAVANTIREKYGVTTVFVATESDQIVQQFKKHPEFTFLYTNQKRHWAVGQSQLGSLRKGLWDPLEEFIVAFANAMAIASADYIVGTVSSNYSRAAYALAVMQGRPDTRFLSLDTWGEKRHVVKVSP